MLMPIARAATAGIVAPQIREATSAETPGTVRRVPTTRTVPPVSHDRPTTHPIKGNFTTYSGERCIYHGPGGQFYDKTKPERCYATKEEARQEGCRRSKRCGPLCTPKTSHRSKAED